MLATTLQITANLIEEYRDLDQQIKALTKQKDALGKELKAGYFLDHEEFIFNGRLLATYYRNEEIRFKQSDFKLKYPELFLEFQDITEVRRFLLK